MKHLVAAAVAAFVLSLPGAVRAQTPVVCPSKRYQFSS